jgi:tryptophan synthase alpha chain
LLDVYVDCGVDVLEVALASPKPYLDGADISQSMARADRETARRDLDAVLVSLARHRHRPSVLLMSYADSDHPGLDDKNFWSGLDSLLVVAPENDVVRLKLEAEARVAGLRPSCFVALPMSDADVVAACHAEFYVMLQAADGATGVRATLDPANVDRIAALRTAGVTAPILPGFGISTGEQARGIVQWGGDGVVVGSAALRAALAGPEALAELLSSLRLGLDG